MKTTVTDHHSEADLALFKSFRGSCKLDFIQWHDDHASFEAMDGHQLGKSTMRRQGYRATLHDVTYRTLAALPQAVKGQPLVGLEICNDFRLSKSERLSVTERLAELEKLQVMIFRRLAPLETKHVAGRIWVQTGHGKRRVSGRHLQQVPKEVTDSSGVKSHRLREYRAPDRLEARLVQPGNQVQSSTVYYGNKVAPPWTPKQRETDEPGAQVRLYIKTMDQGVDLDPKNWSVRIEAHVNAAYLQAIDLGVRTVGDLAALTSLRPIVKPLLQLCSPRATEGAWRRRPGRTRPLDRVILAAFRRPRDRALRDWDERVPVNLADVAGIAFRSDSRLTARMMGPVSDFHRSARKGG